MIIQDRCDIASHNFFFLKLSWFYSMFKSSSQVVVYLWGFYDIKFKLTQYKSKLGLIPQYTFDLREFDITNLKFGSNTTIYLAQHVTLTNYKPKPGLIPQHTKQTTLY